MILAVSPPGFMWTISVSATYSGQAASMRFLEDERRVRWGLHTKDSDRLLLRAQHSQDENDAAPAGFTVVSSMKMLGVVVTSDGSWRPDWECAWRQAWSAFWRHASCRARKALQTDPERRKLLERGVLPTLRWRWALWSSTPGVLDDSNRAHKRMVATVMGLAAAPLGGLGRVQT